MYISYDTIFYFDRHFLFLFFFFQYAHQQWHVRDIEFSYDGRRGQNTAVTLLLHHVQFKGMMPKNKQI